MKGYTPELICRKKFEASSKNQALLELGMVQNHICICKKGMCKEADKADS